LNDKEDAQMNVSIKSDTKGIAILKFIAFICFGLLVLSPSYLLAKDQNTVGLWHFNENKDNVVADASGAGLDGKQVSCEWVKGKFDAALQFNKAGSHVEIPYNKALDLQEFSLEFWVKYNKPPTENVAFMSNRGWLVGDKMTGYTLRDHGGSLYIEILTRGSTSTAGGLRIEGWQFISVTYDKTRTVRLYMDGELKKEQLIAGDILYKGESFWIGAEPSGGYAFGNTGDIAIDEVRVSNIARKQEDMKLVMEKGYDSGMAVTDNQKLSTTWGEIKHR
jgi:hypothetical protein